MYSCQQQTYAVSMWCDCWTYTVCAIHITHITSLFEPRTKQNQTKPNRTKHSNMTDDEIVICQLNLMPIFNWTLCVSIFYPFYVVFFQLESIGFGLARACAYRLMCVLVCFMRSTYTLSILGRIWFYARRNTRKLD